MKIQLTEEQERELAFRIRAVFNLEQDPEEMVHLGDGYGRKSDLGLARTVVGLVEEVTEK
jgi:hypothetical protein